MPEAPAASEPSVTHVAPVMPVMPVAPVAPARFDLPEPLWREVLGGQLRELRRRQDETLAETAARAGISPQYLSKVERGLKEPSSEMIAAVAGALGTTLGGLAESVAEELRALRVQREASRILTASLTSRSEVARPGWGSGPVALALVA